MFYTETDNIENNPDVIEDCWVDGWKGWQMNFPGRSPIPAGPAVNFAGLGPDWVFDSTFTHPPASAQGAIYDYSYYGYYQPTTTAGLFLSNNTAPNFGSGTGILWPRPGVALFTDVIPFGQRGGLVSSASQTFLKTAWPADGSSVLDVTQAPYTADRTGGTDSTATIQAAINAASAANGGSVVYFPVGLYKISSTLTASGGNYTLQGTGSRSALLWTGAAGGTLLAISSPQNVAVQGLSLDSGVNSVSGTALLETAAGPSAITYDDLYCPLYYDAQGGHLPPGQGLVLSNLPAGSTAYLKHVKTPLQVVNCGAAHVLAKFLEFSTINVSGAAPQTGFLGVMEGEGGQDVIPSAYNVTIRDNQDFVMNDYYTETQTNGLDLERGSGTGFGRVSISGVNSQVKTSAATTAVQVNNYQGRLFYTSDLFADSGVLEPFTISETGTNPLDLIFAGNWFYDNGVQPFTPAPATTLIGALNTFDFGNGMSFQPTSSPGWFSSTDNAQTAYALASEAAGLDHFRQLETAEGSQQAGLVGNWKLDEATGATDRDSTISGLDGVPVNGPAFSAAAPPGIGLTDPGSLSFNGVNQYVSIPVTPTLPSGKAPRTLCGWAKSNSLAGGWRWIAAYGSPNTSQAMFIGMNGTTLYGGGYGDDLSVPNFWDGNWHFIALTYDGATARLYADGSLRATALKTWNLAPAYCCLGEQVNGLPEYWSGSIDDVRIYNRALSGAEISSLAGH